MQLFPSARDFDGPGQVFRVDPSGQWVPVVDLSSQLPVESHAETMPALFQNQELRAGVALSFLGGNAASAGAVAQRRLALSIVALGTKRERAQENNVIPVVRAALPQITFRPDSRYYVITETVRADSVQITLSRSAVDSLGGKTRIKTIVDATPSIGARDTTYASLIMRLTPPQRVFYKVLAITPGERHLGGGQVTDVAFVPVTHILDVQQEQRGGR